MTVLCAIKTDYTHLVIRPKNDENLQVKEFYYVVKEVLPVHAMKAHRGSRYIAPFINLCTRWR
jgi:hypothetical protein